MKNLALVNWQTTVCAALAGIVRFGLPPMLPEAAQPLCEQISYGLVILGLYFAKDGGK